MVYTYLAKLEKWGVTNKQRKESQYIWKISEKHYFPWRTQWQKKW